MGVTQDGNNLTFQGTVTVVNGVSESGVAYLVLTPSGGFGTLPFLATGDSGLPPVFNSITMVEVDPSQPLPAVNPVTTLINPGGPGVASQYSLKFYIHAGAAGSTGTVTISNATDLASSPALGIGTNAYILTYNSSTSQWVPSAQKVGNIYIPSTILGTAFGNASPRLLSSMVIPAQATNWYPRVFAEVPVTGSSDTRVDIVARLNDPASGAQLGYSQGQVGASPPNNVLIPAPVAGTSASAWNVAAGSAATVYLRAEQQAPSSNSWATAASGTTSPFTTFCVEVVPTL